MKQKCCKIKGLDDCVIFKCFKIYSRNQRRPKRQKSNISPNRPNNLFLEYLIVIDSSVYNMFLLDYGNLNPSLMNQYINIFFMQIVNGVNTLTHFNYLLFDFIENNYFK